jgi:hypothetical protein
MAAAVSAASTWRLLPGPAGSSGKLALVGVSPPDAVGLGTGAGACAAGPIKATGFTETDGVIAATGALLAGALWRPTESAPNAVSPKRISTAQPLIPAFKRSPAERASCAVGPLHALILYLAAQLADCVICGASFRQCRAVSISALVAPWLRAHASAAEAVYLAT